MPQDILLNSDYDLATANGDFRFGESTVQHQALIIGPEPGEFRQWPEATVGVQKFVDDDATGDLEGVIKEKFEADGMKVRTIKVFETGKIQLDADYGDIKPR